MRKVYVQGGTYNNRVDADLLDIHSGIYLFDNELSVARGQLPRVSMDNIMHHWNSRDPGLSEGKTPGLNCSAHCKVTRARSKLRRIFSVLEGLRVTIVGQVRVERYLCTLEREID